ncbi:MAG: valine--tRNA ligase [Candidatus Gracilibacteria bacterium]|jgi:valyl-tRNA synthetase
MIEIEKAYEAKKYEDKIYAKWESSGAFKPKIDKKKKPFVISMPPPNATGVLHLGHAVMLALQDIMIRYNRMQGAPTLWLPGTDHASIATQNKVEQLLAQKNITKYDLGREEFLKEVDKYVKNSQSTIRNQIRKMGSSCDWTRERYTLDEGLTNAVQKVFLKMYKDGLIYRGSRIVNWCPRCESTLADDEVNYKESKEKLYWIVYGPFTVATTRPETKLGDTAVAVNPADKRYKKMIGKVFPIKSALGEYNIVVIADKEVDMEFGSGAVKVTPAHSFADFEMAQRNKEVFKKAGIEPIKEVIDEKGRMKENCGKYSGMTTKECRKALVADLEKMGLIEKIEDYTHNLSICYRCGHTIEPLISKQWFIDVDKPIIKDGAKKKSIKEKSIEVVKKGEIEIIPERFNKTYFNWMKNLHDWCISRQIWFGHKIPVWYKMDEKSKKEYEKNPEKNRCLLNDKEAICSIEKPDDKNYYIQDPDTLDTWFSSGLWTFSTLGWPDKTEDFKYFHPTSVLETGYDILFFWVARMIIMTEYTLGEVPFKTVYLHGLIRDKNGKKMSKSAGNGIDPLEMIAKYGTDPVRLSLVIGGTPGNDMCLSEDKIEGYRNFINKIWNASRFALMNVSEEDLKKKIEPKMAKSTADKWILTELNGLVKATNADMEKYNFSEAGMRIYEFIWSKYCDWYLEISKGEHKNPVVLLHVLKTTLKLLHPFIPFVTEKLWELMGEKTMLISQSWPKEDKNTIFKKEAKDLEEVMEMISKIRSLRAELKVEPAKKINAIIYAGKQVKLLEEKREVIVRMARLENLQIEEKGKKIEGAKLITQGTMEIYLPLKDMLDIEKENKRIKEEMAKKQALILSIESRLSNEGFVKNAPKDLITKEKERLKEEKLSLAKMTENMV